MSLVFIFFFLHSRFPLPRYFLLMFGLRGLIKLLLGEDSSALDESRQMQAQMGMGMGGGNQMGFNADAAFKVWGGARLGVRGACGIAFTEKYSFALLHVLTSSIL